MPEPDRWNECLQMLNGLYNEAQLDNDTFKKIKCPVLLMNGDHNEYYPAQAVVEMFQALPNSQLSMIPGCGHVIFYCKPEMVLMGILPFFKN